MVSVFQHQLILVLAHYAMWTTVRFAKEIPNHAQTASQDLEFGKAQMQHYINANHVKLDAMNAIITENTVLYVSVDII